MSATTMSMMLIIGGAVLSVAMLAVALLFRRDEKRDPDLGTVSRSWTIEYNASHGKDSSAS
jgi:hypothetical protein